MQNFFTENSSYYFFEQQMRQPPGYRQRGHGIHIFNQPEWQEQRSCEEIISAVISRMQMECLESRLNQSFPPGRNKILFKDKKHRKTFDSLMLTYQKPSLQHTTNYAGAVFLLAAEEDLLTKASPGILESSIYFDRIKIGRVTLDQYILFHTAKDIYNRTRHVSISELADRELIPDHIFRLIISAFVISQCGTKIIEKETQNAHQ